MTGIYTKAETVTKPDPEDFPSFETEVGLVKIRKNENNRLHPREVRINMNAFGGVTATGLTDQKNFDFMPQSFQSLLVFNEMRRALAVFTDGHSTGITAGTLIAICHEFPPTWGTLARADSWKFDESVEIDTLPGVVNAVAIDVRRHKWVGLVKAPEDTPFSSAGDNGALVYAYLPSAKGANEFPSWRKPEHIHEREGLWRLHASKK